MAFPDFIIAHLTEEHAASSAAAAHVAEHIQHTEPAAKVSSCSVHASVGGTHVIIPASATLQLLQRMKESD